LQKAITKFAQIVVTGALLALSAGVAQANQLTNGGFETDDASGGNIGGATGWTTFGSVFTTANDGPNSAPVSRDQPGDQSILMFGPFVPGDASGAFQSFAVTPGLGVTLEAWVMNWVGDPFQNLGILQLTFWDGANGSGNQVGGNIEQFADTLGTPGYVDLSVIQDGAEVTDWTQMLVSGVVPAGAVSAKAFLLHVQLGDTPFGGSLYWDYVCTGSLEDCRDDDVPPEVPIPPSVWLFGSGLLGLVGMARRKKAA
jgi:hypothetical protein